MFYKKDNNGNWSIGSKISFPDGTTIDEHNKESKDGWKWYKNPPKAYIEWRESQEDILPINTLMS